MDDKMWTKEIGEKLIQSVFINFGNDEVIHVTGDNKPITIHEGGNEKDCYFCKERGKLSAEDFQCFYGTYHVYNNKEKGWFGYQGKNGRRVNFVSDDQNNIIESYLNNF